MKAPTGAMQLIYKLGSQLGEGTVIGLPHAWVNPGLAICYPADTMTLHEDEKTFTYTYYRPEDIVHDGQVMEKAGTITFTVDLPTGEVTEDLTPPTYEGALAHVTRKRIKTPSESSENREVVRLLETGDCSIVLTKGRFVETYDDYILSLVYKPGSAMGNGTIRQLILPSTVYDKGYPGTIPPTGRRILWRSARTAPPSPIPTPLTKLWRIFTRPAPTPIRWISQPGNSLWRIPPTEHKSPRIRWDAGAFTFVEVRL